MTVGAFIILVGALVTLYNWIQGLVVVESVSARSAFRADVFLLLHAMFRGYVSACRENIAGAAKRFLRPVNLINLHKPVVSQPQRPDGAPGVCLRQSDCLARRGATRMNLIGQLFSDWVVLLSLNHHRGGDRHHRLSRGLCLMPHQGLIAADVCERTPHRMACLVPAWLRR